MTNSHKILLASSSPRRRFLLEEARLQHDILKVEFEEILSGTESIYDAPLLLSESKSDQCPAPKENEIIITCDTIVANNGKILGKPLSPDEAKNFLKSFSNNSHLVISGTTLRAKEKIITFNSISEVKFYSIPEKAINEYITTGNPMDKAGAYGIQDSFGIQYVKEIKGCYYNIMGLPVSQIIENLKLF